MLKRGLSFYRNAYRGLPRAVWLLSLVTLVNRAGTMVLFFMTLYLTAELEMSVTFAGSVLGVYGVGALLGTLVGGRLTDAWGSKRVLWLSLLTASINFLALEFLRTPSAILTGMFTLGLFSESHRPAGSTAVAEVCPAEIRVRAYGLYRLAINVGSTIGPALGGLFAAQNYVLLFRIDGLTCLLAAGLVSLLPLGGKNRVEASLIDNPDAAGDSPVRDVPFLLFTVISIGIGCIFFQIFSTYPVYLKDHYHLAEDQIGLLLSFNGLLIITFEMVLLHAIENRSPLKMIAIGIVFTGLGFCHSSRVLGDGICRCKCLALDNR